MPRLHFTANASSNFIHAPFESGPGNRNLLAITDAGQTPAEYGIPLPVLTRDFVVNSFRLFLSDAFQMNAQIMTPDSQITLIVPKQNSDTDLFYTTPIVVQGNGAFFFRHTGGVGAGWVYSGWLDWEQWIL